MPCVIFDGKSEDFATEMFVIINSTPTRINKSHLVDLYEKRVVGRARQEARRAGRRPALRARATARCATRSTASAAARSRRSGSCRPSCSTRSTAGWPRGAPPEGQAARRARATSSASRATSSTSRCATSSRRREGAGRARGATSATWSPAPSRSRRCCASAPTSPRRRASRRSRRGAGRASCAAWSELEPDFRVEGFYERFPAKGQVERVARIHRRIDQLLGITPIAAAKEEE